MLTTLGFSAAERVAAGSANGFIGAMRGLKNIMGTLMTSNPLLTISLIAGAATTIITMIKSATNSSEKLKEKKNGQEKREN